MNESEYVRDARMIAEKFRHLEETLKVMRTEVRDGIKSLIERLDIYEREGNSAGRRLSALEEDLRLIGAGVALILGALATWIVRILS